MSRPNYSLRVHLTSMADSEFDALWVEAERWDGSGVLPEDAKIRDLAAQWIDEPNLVHMLDVQHQICMRWPPGPC